MSVTVDSPKKSNMKSFLAVGALAFAGILAFAASQLNTNNADLSSAQSISPAASSVVLAASGPTENTDLFANAGFDASKITETAAAPVLVKADIKTTNDKTVKKAKTTLTGKHIAKVNIASTASLTNPKLTASIEPQTLLAESSTVADAFLGQPVQVTVGKQVQLEGKYVKLMSDGTKEVWQNDTVNGDAHLATVKADGNILQHKDGWLNQLAVKQALSDPLLDTAIKFSDFNTTGDKEADLASMQSRHGKDIWEKKAWHPVRMAADLDPTINRDDFSEENTKRSQQIVGAHQIEQLGNAISDAGTSISNGVKSVFTKPASFWVDTNTEDQVAAVQVEDRSTHSVQAVAAQNAVANEEVRTYALSPNPVQPKLTDVASSSTNVQIDAALVQPEPKVVDSPAKSRLLQTGSVVTGEMGGVDTAKLKTAQPTEATKATGHQKGANISYTSHQNDKGEMVVKQGDKVVGYIGNGKVFNDKHAVVKGKDRSAVLDAFQNSQQVDTPKVSNDDMSNIVKTSSVNFQNIMENVRLNAQIGQVAKLNSPKNV